MSYYSTALPHLSKQLGGLRRAFPAMLAGPVIWRKIEDNELYRAVVRAYNQWLAEDYCSVTPDRLIGIGVIPQTNISYAVSELQHGAKLGLRAVVLGNFPSGNDYPSPEDDQFWSAALDTGVAVTVHTKLNPLAGVAGPIPPRLFVYPQGRSGDYAANATRFL